MKKPTMAICNSCFWRRRVAGSSDGWDGTVCAYTLETGNFRETPPTDKHCDYYLTKRPPSLVGTAKGGRSKNSINIIARKENEVK